MYATAPEAAGTPMAGESGETLVTRELLRDWEAFSIRVSEASPGEQVLMLRAAGDWYLEEFGDIESAAQCYRVMFGIGEDTSVLRPHGGDNWLLASLKLARAEENSDENQQG